MKGQEEVLDLELGDGEDHQVITLTIFIWSSQKFWETETV